ncbi:hypothetical protein [Spirochaeta dissipatitropha]
MVSEQIMSDIISTIVNLTSPKKIILFGSYARKTMLAERGSLPMLEQTIIKEGHTLYAA